MRHCPTALALTILAMHLIIAAGLACASANYANLVGLAVLAYGLGLRHAVDPDHVAAIDNTVRKLMQDGQRPYAVGFFFALGHSTIVLIVATMVGLSSSFVTTNLPTFRETGSLIGSLISCLFLLLIGTINISILLDTFKIWQKRHTDPAAYNTLSTSHSHNHSLVFFNRLLTPLMGLVNASNKMFWVGLLFGLGFDTASEVALLSLTAVTGARALPLWAILLLPGAFAAGMTLIDTLDGVLMLSAYGWAFFKPARKLLYNMTITLTSVLLALFIGGIEAFSLICRKTDLSNQIVVALHSLHFEDWGVYVVATFALLWLTCVLTPKAVRLVNRATIALTLIGLSYFISTGAAYCKQQDAIQLKQSHYFLGDDLITAAKDAIRIENTGRFGFIVVASAPDWRVSIFRHDDKSYFSENLKLFEDTGLVSEFLVSRREHYLDPATYRKALMKFLGYSAIRMTKPGHCVKYLPLEKGTAQQVEQIVHATYKLSTCGGLPVEDIGTSGTRDFISGQGKSHREVYLSTSSIKPVKVSSDIFTLPKNYTLAKSVREVMSGSNSRKESVDAQELFETGRENHKK
jgi:high-affinity nickel-transport protein